MHGYPQQPGYGYAPPPPKKGMGCFAIACIVIAACAVGTVATCAIAVKLGGPSAAKQKQLDQQQANLEDAARVAKDEADVAELVALQKVCKVKPDRLVLVLTHDRVRTLCKATAEASLKAPSTARFPSETEEGDHLLTDDGGCRMIYKSWVEAKNAFGVPLRTRYSCVFDPRDLTLSAKVTFAE